MVQSCQLDVQTVLKFKKSKLQIAKVKFGIVCNVFLQKNIILKNGTIRWEINCDKYTSDVLYDCAEVFNRKKNSNTLPPGVI